MTTRPSYIRHHVDEEHVTVDWFFGRQRLGTKATQLVLVLLGWFFTVLPVVITASALLNRNNDNRGWWGYHEGFVMWDLTMAVLGILICFFVVGFFVLHVIDRAGARRRAKENTYDEPRLKQRLQITADWYTDKFGPEAERGQQTRIRIEPWGDIETYELRGLYRQNGVE
ncbi:hypothetical protein RCF27_11900 [Rhodococcus pyridinivorans]|uniref:hypothetical protein n=1 Tax=Rhodococcus pyridinivorans TaxID=103816 RepID=UPI00280ADC27|nr:hypothetical protein [Rhodococcus pyridinivorans]WMM74915.1 hypothetical protein RCF27_11900 [Rhodococcus pyridinivorans]